MKAILTVLSLFVVGTASANNKSSIALSCYDSSLQQTVFTLQLPKDFMNQNSGDVEVTLSTGQILMGTYGSQVINDNSRLSGATEFNIEANYSLPDYSKPHTLSVSIVGYSDPQISYSGNASLLSLTGHQLNEYLVTCKLPN